MDVENRIIKRVDELLKFYVGFQDENNTCTGLEFFMIYRAMGDIPNVSINMLKCMEYLYTEYFVAHSEGYELYICWSSGTNSIRNLRGTMEDISGKQIYDYLKFFEQRGILKNSKESCDFDGCGVNHYYFRLTLPELEQKYSIDYKDRLYFVLPKALVNYFSQRSEFNVKTLKVYEYFFHNFIYEGCLTFSEPHIDIVHWANIQFKEIVRCTELLQHARLISVFSVSNNREYFTVIVLGDVHSIINEDADVVSLRRPIYDKKDFKTYLDYCRDVLAPDYVVADKGKANYKIVLKEEYSPSKNRALDDERAERRINRKNNGCNLKLV